MKKCSTSSGAFGTAGSGKPDQIRGQYPDSPEKEPLWKQFLEKAIPDPIIKILLVALLLSVGVACYQFLTGAESASVFLEPAGILAAILLATCVGFAFEVSANRKFEILNQVNDDTMVQVIRGGNICELPRRDVVVGDIVILNTGEEVPADGVLLEAVSLQVNESTLTGEPLIGKTTDEGGIQEGCHLPLQPRSERNHRGGRPRRHGSDFRGGQDGIRQGL